MIIALLNMHVHKYARSVQVLILHVLPSFVIFKNPKSDMHRAPYRSLQVKVPNFLCGQVFKR